MVLGMAIGGVGRTPLRRGGGRNGGRIGRRQGGLCLRRALRLLRVGDLSHKIMGRQGRLVAVLTEEDSRGGVEVDKGVG